MDGILEKFSGKENRAASDRGVGTSPGRWLCDGSFAFASSWVRKDDSLTASFGVTGRRLCLGLLVYVRMTFRGLAERPKSKGGESAGCGSIASCSDDCQRVSGGWSEGVAYWKYRSSRTIPWRKTNIGKELPRRTDATEMLRVNVSRKIMKWVKVLEPCKEVPKCSAALVSRSQFGGCMIEPGAIQCLSKYETWNLVLTALPVLGTGMTRIIFSLYSHFPFYCSALQKVIRCAPRYLRLTSSWASFKLQAER